MAGVSGKKMNLAEALEYWEYLEHIEAFDDSENDSDLDIEHQHMAKIHINHLLIQMGLSVMLIRVMRRIQVSII